MTREESGMTLNLLGKPIELNMIGTEFQGLAKFVHIEISNLSPM